VGAKPQSATPGLVVKSIVVGSHETSLAVIPMDDCEESSGRTYSPRAGKESDLSRGHDLVLWETTKSAMIPAHLRRPRNDYAASHHLNFVNKVDQSLKGATNRTIVSFQATLVNRHVDHAILRSPHPSTSVAHHALHGRSKACLNEGRHVRVLLEVLARSVITDSEMVPLERETCRLFNYHTATDTLFDELKLWIDSALEVNSPLGHAERWSNTTLKHSSPDPITHDVVSVLLRHQFGELQPN
jgi:hypothetical protein